MGYTQSPLRYAGGKTNFSVLLAEFIELNGLRGGIYVEPYAGGAGAGLNLLFAERVSRLILNDADRSIYLFWKAVLLDTEGFVKLIKETPITIDEWQRRKEIIKNAQSHSELEVAFSTFYLNRCNRSGILNAGPIGGKFQTGKWRLDARFKKDSLIKKIQKIAFYSARISIYNLDAIQFIERYILPLAETNNRLLVYLDPPYYSKGDRLYLNYYTPEDHAKLAEFINGQCGFKWIISYDDVSKIREFYSNRVINKVSRYHSAHRSKIGNELIIFSPNSVIPDVSNIS